MLSLRPEVPWWRVVPIRMITKYTNAWRLPTRDHGMPAKWGFHVILRLWYWYMIHFCALDAIYEEFTVQTFHLTVVLNRIVNLPDTRYLPDTWYQAGYLVDPDILPDTWYPAGYHPDIRYSPTSLDCPWIMLNQDEHQGFWCFPLPRRRLRWPRRQLGQAWIRPCTENHGLCLVWTSYTCEVGFIFQSYLSKHISQFYNCSASLYFFSVVFGPLRCLDLSTCIPARPVTKTSDKCTCENPFSRSCSW